MAIFAAMAILFVAGLPCIYAAEIGRQSAASPRCRSTSRPATWRARKSASASPTPRFGPRRRPPPPTARSTPCTTASRRSAAWSLMLNIQLGEVIFGGVGAGLYGMLLFVVLTVFIAGLMVGRTPEYLGKKIEAREVKLAALAFLSMPRRRPRSSARSPPRSCTALAAVQDPGPHGLSEILYAYSSATGNNGSAFAGFSANCRLAQHAAWARHAARPLSPSSCRCWPSPARSPARRPAPASAGTFPTHGPLFVTLLDRRRS